MKITFLDQEFDIDEINTYTDIIKYLDNIKGQDKIIYDKDLEAGPKYVEYDFLTPKEKAQVNLYLTLQDIRIPMAEQLFPAKDTLKNMIEQMLSGSDSAKIAIDQELFGHYSKLSYLTETIKTYIDFNLCARLGFDMLFMFKPNGKVYALKDIRDLPSEIGLI